MDYDKFESVVKQYFVESIPLVLNKIRISNDFRNKIFIKDKCISYKKNGNTEHIKIKYSDYENFYMDVLDLMSENEINMEDSLKIKTIVEKLLEFRIRKQLEKIICTVN